MARRITGVLIMMLLAFAGALPLTGVAQADDEAVSGTCEATVGGQGGEPLTVDADAVTGTEVLPAVRLGSTSDTERREYQDAVEVPVGDLLEPATESTGVTDTACGAVDTTADTANRVARTARTTLAVAAPSTDGPDDTDTVPPDDPQPEPEQPQSGDTPGVEAPLDEVPAQAMTLPLTNSVAGFGLPAFSLPKIAMPDAAAATGPHFRIGGRPDYDTNNTGQAQALPGTPAEQPARAPFVLAVGLLAVVAAALVRRWVTRAVS